MCGITGWIDWEKDLTGEGSVIEAMAATLAHRGPDAAGTWLSARCAFGHRRLVVVDPAGGAQPMARRRWDKVYVIVYNGELYNTPDIRRELEARGHVFQGYSDTEALLLAFIEWGPECLARLNGIFAFAVWSEADQRLFMARDRLGVKPLFYAERGSAFIFGSELKAILAHPAVEPVVDAEGLAEVMLMGPARTPGCGVFRGVTELRPGRYLSHDQSGTRVRTYWSLESHPHPDDLETTVATVRELLRDTVERQLVADVPVCTLLSGGLDSSAVTAFVAAAYGGPGGGLGGDGGPAGGNGHRSLHTYSIDYAGNDRHFRANQYQPDADGPWVRRVSDLFGTSHHHITIDTPELAAALKDSVRANDLPGFADVDSSLLLFCREVKRGATVALSGEAADEVWGGYPWFRNPEALSAETFPWARSTAARASLLAPDLAGRINGEEYVSRRYCEALAEVPRLPGEGPEEARLREVFYLNITRFMPTLLDRKDRMSMASGLEVRVPYCDHRLVEYAWNIPAAMKFAGGREKGLLRLALRGVLPDDVIMRKKSPYPKTHNPAYLAAVRGWLEEALADPSSPLLGLIDVARVHAVIAGDGAAFGTSWFGQLMGGAQLFAYLAQVDHWLREYRVSFR
ncbi:MAG: asparagine synthase (glutamine-hydrolyzing) [Bacillota bacterium]